MLRAMTRILLIQAHPRPHSFGAALAERYERAARAAGHELRRVDLHTLRFDPLLHQGYDVVQPLEPDLQALQRDLLWAQHWVIAYPVWWGSVPALLKGLLDRVLLPGFAFRYQPGQALPERLLRGRSARLLVTLDTPGWYFRLFQGASAHRMMRDAVLGFCGIRPVRVSAFAPIQGSSAARREAWLARAEALGRRGR